MACNNCVPDLGLSQSCINKATGGHEMTLYFIAMCKLAEDPFTEGYDNGIVSDIALLNAELDGFLAITCNKDSVKVDMATDPINRMVVPTLVFDVQMLDADPDRLVAAANARAFLQKMIDNNQPLCFILEERKNSRNITMRRIYPCLAPEPFAITTGMKAEEAPKATLTFKGPVEQLPFVLDNAYEIPLAP